MNRIDRLSKIAQDEFGVTIRSKPSTGETFESLYDETISIDRDEKQIEELSKVIDKSPWKVEQDATGVHINNYEIAKYLYNACYRKQSEVVKEIFEEIEDCMSCFEDDDDGYLLKKCEFEFFMRELKKKYTEFLIEVVINEESNLV